MRLISAYIDSFGRLSQYTYEFGDGINMLFKPNGWGKTTFVNFICAMLFGLPATRVRDPDENLRKKYTPVAGGGYYGGVLTFEHEGRLYRMERSFGKNEQADTFRLFDGATNQPSGDFTSDIGVEIYGVDRETFIRTMYMSEQAPQMTMEYSGLQSRLVGADDFLNADKALEILDKQRKIYFLSGGKGKIGDDTRLLRDTEQRLSEAESAATRYRDSQLALQRLESEKKTAAEKLAKTEELLRALGELCESEGAAEKRKENEALLQKLEAKKAAATAQLDKARGLVAAYEKDKAQKRTEAVRQSLYSDRDKAQSLCDSYAEIALPSAEECDRVTEDCRKYIAASAQNLKIDEKPLRDAKKNTTKSIGMGILIAAVLTACAGMLYPLLLAVAAALLALGVALTVSGKRSDREAGASEPARQVPMPRLSRETTEFAEKYCAGETDALSLITAAAELRGKRSAGDAAVADCEAKKARCTEFDAANPPCPLSSVTDAEMQAAAEESERLSAEINELVGAIAQTNRSIGTPGDAAGNALSLKQRIKELKGACLSETADEVSEEQVRAAAQQLNVEIGKMAAEEEEIRRSIWTLRSSAEAVPELKQRVNELNETITADTEALDVIKRASALLRAAQNKLKSSYLDSIENAFDGYIERICAEDPEAARHEYRLSPSFDITVSIRGKSCEFAYLSAGLRALVNLCLRLALADAVYKDTCMPPLILDDTLSTLDDSHYNGAVGLMRQFAAEHQVLYITCHSSRANI